MVYLARTDVHSAVASQRAARRGPEARGAARLPGRRAGPPGGPPRRARAPRTQRRQPGAAARRPSGPPLDRAAALGIACVHECGGPDIGGEDDFRALLALEHGVRPGSATGASSTASSGPASSARSAPGGDLFADGSLGSHTACAVRAVRRRADARRRLPRRPRQVAAARRRRAPAPGCRPASTPSATRALTAVLDGRRRLPPSRSGCRRCAPPGTGSSTPRCSTPAHIAAHGRATAWSPACSRSSTPAGAAADGHVRRRGSAPSGPRGINPYAALAAAGRGAGPRLGQPGDRRWTRGATVRAAVAHRTPGSGLSARAAFSAHTRGGWRAARVDGVGELVPGRAGDLRRLGRARRAGRADAGRPGRRLVDRPAGGRRRAARPRRARTRACLRTVVARTCRVCRGGRQHPPDLRRLRASSQVRRRVDSPGRCAGTVTCGPPPAASGGPLDNGAAAAPCRRRVGPKGRRPVPADPVAARVGGPPRRAGRLDGVTSVLRELPRRRRSPAPGAPGRAGAACAAAAGALVAGLLLVPAFPPRRPSRPPPSSASPPSRWPCRGARPRAGALARPGRRARRCSCRCCEWSGAVAGPAALVALALLQAAFLAPLGAALRGRPRGCRAGRVWAAALWVRSGGAARPAARSAASRGGGSPSARATARSTPLAALGGAPLVTFVVALLGGAAGGAAALRPDARAGCRRRRGRRRWPSLGGALLVPTPTDGPTDAGRRGAGQRAAARAVGLHASARPCCATTSTRPASWPPTSGPGTAPRPTSWSGRRTPPTSTPSATPRRTPLIDGAVRDVGVPVLVGRRRATGPGDQVSNTGIVWDPRDRPGGDATSSSTRSRSASTCPFRDAAAPGHRQGRPRAARLRRRRPRPALLQVGPAARRRRHLLRGRLRRPGARRGPGRRQAARRADQQRDLRPQRARPRSSWRWAGCAPSSTAGPCWSPRPAASAR